MEDYINIEFTFTLTAPDAASKTFAAEVTDAQGATVAGGVTSLTFDNAMGLMVPLVAMAIAEAAALVALLKGWLAHTRSSSFDRTNSMDDKELMANRRVIAYDEEDIPRPTLAGLLAMGSYPQKYFPRLNVVFTCYPMSMKGEVDASGSRGRAEPKPHQ